MTLTLNPIWFDHRLTEPVQKENLGIIVQYKVKVKLCLGALGGSVKEWTSAIGCLRSSATNLCHSDGVQGLGG